MFGVRREGGVWDEEGGKCLGCGGKVRCLE